MTSRATQLVLTFFLLFLGLVALEKVRPNSLPWFDRLYLRAVLLITEGVTTTREKTSGLVHRYFYLVGVEAENEQLQRHLQEMTVREALEKEMGTENDRLHSLLDLKKNLPDRWVVARVVAVPPLGEFRLATLDKGRESGVSLRNPVLTPEGLVGQIWRVGKNFSQVLLMTDPTSAVDARVARTGARGLIIGRAADLHFKRELFIGAFEFWDRSEQVRPGDRVETTGLDGVFPPGVPVGEIHHVSRNPWDVFLEAQVIPSVDFHQLREVIVAIGP